MERRRRRVLRMVASALSAVALSGCGTPGTPTDTTGTSGDTNTADTTTATDTADTTAEPTAGGNDVGDATVDAPPYEITEPACDPPDESGDPLWLCANAPAEPSLAFEQVETRGDVLREPAIDRSSAPEQRFYAALVTDRDGLDRFARDRGDPAWEFVESTSFDASAVLLIQTGWGSGSVTPHVKRIEETDDGVRAVGCYRRPCVQTDDLTLRTTLVRFDRPDSLDAATVRLTVDAETRVTFGTDDGVVGISEER